MREQWARRITFLTGLLILLLAIVFAISQNPEGSTGTDTSVERLLSTGDVKAVDLDPQRVDAGRQVYQQQACARCHSIAGEGNKNSPLDGVGGRREAEELQDWIIGADSLQGVLPDRAFNQKQAHKDIPADDLDVLVIYMQSLSSALPRTSVEQFPSTGHVEAIDLDPQRVDAGRQIYHQQACERCHSIAGEGNENSPLDDVGGRREADELRDWIIGADNLQGMIPERAFNLKQVNKELPADDLDALVIYTQSLSSALPRTSVEQFPLTGHVEAIDLDPQRVDAGRQIYHQQACERCHSIAGEGNENSPLDDVGGRREADELRDWIIGADNLQGMIPERAFNLKQVNKELPADDLDALVIYTQSLSSALPRTSVEQFPSTGHVEAIDLDPQRVDAGRQIYHQQACERCHSIAGEGNENSPLDDVGGRREADELRDWIIGADNLQGMIPERAFNLKQVNKELPADDLDALVIYTQSLRPELPGTSGKQRPSTGVVEAVDLDPQRVDAGHQVYQELACSRCRDRNLLSVEAFP